MELISKEAAVYRMKEAAEFPYNAVSKHSLETLKEAEEILESMPTIEAEPVVHAHWEDRGGGVAILDENSHTIKIIGMTCTHCGKRGDSIDKFCKHCGAKMDEEVD